MLIKHILSRACRIFGGHSEHSTSPLPLRSPNIDGTIREQLEMHIADRLEKSVNTVHNEQGNDGTREAVYGSILLGDNSVRAQLESDIADRLERSAGTFSKRRSTCSECLPRG